MDMKPLYTVKSLYSMEEFMRFNRTLRFRNKKIVVFLSILDVLLLALTLLCLINGSYIWAAIAGFYLLFLNWYLFRGIDSASFSFSRTISTPSRKAAPPASVTTK